MKTLCILAALVICAFADLSKKMGEDCMHHTECEDGCCMMMMDKAMRCHMKGIMGEKCNMMSTANDACMCMDGMMCMADSLIDTKYGMCMKMTA
ncbi:hypothetical protein BsWGS_11521 [Bradybaena similaris]